MVSADLMNKACRQAAFVIRVITHNTIVKIDHTPVNRSFVQVPAGSAPVLISPAPEMTTQGHFLNVKVVFLAEIVSTDRWA